MLVCILGACFFTHDTHGPRHRYQDQTAPTMKTGIFSRFLLSGLVISFASALPGELADQEDMEGCWKMPIPEGCKFPAFSEACLCDHRKRLRIDNINIHRQLAQDLFRLYALNEAKECTPQGVPTEFILDIMSSPTCPVKTPL